MKELHVHEITGHSLVPAKEVPALSMKTILNFRLSTV